MDWVRLWLDMPNDPKWRAIARKSGQRVGDVVAVFTHMLCQARASSDPGYLESWDDDDVGAALDLDAEDVAAIRDAMQGKVLDGYRLLGWEKRQPQREREDNSTDRVRKHRERKRAQAQHDETPVKHHVTPPDTEADTDTEDNGCSDEHPSPAGEVSAVVPMPDRPAPKQVAEQMIEIWHDECGDILPRVEKITDKRQKMANARLHDDLSGDLEAWRAVCRRVRASPFLRGETGNWPGADFEWCVRPNNLPKIMEGKYDPKPDNRAKQQQPGNPALAAFARYRASADGG